MLPRLSVEAPITVRRKAYCVTKLRAPILHLWQAFPAYTRTQNRVKHILETLLAYVFIDLRRYRSYCP